MVDFSDIDNSWSILPLDNLGNPFSAHYRDLTYIIQVNFEEKKMNKEEIILASTKLILKPAKN
jgi:penicillin amidase